MAAESKPAIPQPAEELREILNDPFTQENYSLLQKFVVHMEISGDTFRGVDSKTITTDLLNDNELMNIWRSEQQSSQSISADERFYGIRRYVDTVISDTLKREVINSPKDIRPFEMQIVSNSLSTHLEDFDLLTLDDLAHNYDQKGLLGQMGDKEIIILGALARDPKILQLKKEFTAKYEAKGPVPTIDFGPYNIELLKLIKIRLDYLRSWFMSIDPELPYI